MIASTRALERPCSIAATMPARWAVIVLASLTNGARRHRLAHVTPLVEQPDRGVGGQPVDLARLLFEQVRAVQPRVGALDARELGLLAAGEVVGVLPQREACALQIPGERDVSGPAGRVPDLAADLVQRVGGEHHDVEGVQAQLGLRAALSDRAGDPWNSPDFAEL